MEGDAASSNMGLTAILLGVLTIAVFIVLLEPLLPRANTNNTNHTAAGAQPTRTTTTTSFSSQTKKTPCTRSPVHLVSVPFNNGSNVLNSDGLISFIHTKAAQQQRLGTTETIDRKERAKLLAALLHDTTCPAKGATVVVAMDTTHHTLECRHQQRVLELLASYYNLLVILIGNNKENPTREACLAQLRATTLSPDLLPSHRIVMCRTIEGRVAFVRQLQRVELVLESCEEAKSLLTRFGHRVVVYPAASDPKVSRLGNVLLKLKAN